MKVDSGIRTKTFQEVKIDADGYEVYNEDWEVVYETKFIKEKYGPDTIWINKLEFSNVEYINYTTEEIKLDNQGNEIVTAFVSLKKHLIFHRFLLPFFNKNR